MTQRQYWPIFTLVQCIFCFFLWLVTSLRDGTVEAGLDSIWPGKTDLTVQWDCVDYRLEVWRWWTYQYTHVGFLHVAMNCIMTILFGISLEGVHGSVRMFIMWNIGVFGGACCYFVSDIHTRVVGMSGGVYALMGMHFGDVLMNFDEQRRATKHYKDTFSDGVRSTVHTKWKKMIIPPHWKLLALLVILAIDLVQGFATRSSSTSHSAHFGGFVAGFLVCVVVGQNLVIKNYERVLWVLAVGIGLALAAACVAWGMSWPPQEIFEQVRWCWGRQIANVTAFGNNEWHCVRCADDACIARWARQKYIQAVSDRVCQKNGGWAVTER
jgi:rhomboid-related protein 1/2/3